MKYFQNSLFPDIKEPFNADEFQSKQLSESVTTWISSAITTAHTKIQIIADGQGVSSRAKSDLLHDIIFLSIKEGSINLPDGIKPVFHVDFSGNKKQYFELDGYRYILRKSGVRINGTRIESAIRNQELPMHVITIEYTVSPMWDTISSISFKYIKGDGVEFEYTVPLNGLVSKSTTNDTIEETNSETGVYIPRFKKAPNKQAQ